MLRWKSTLVIFKCLQKTWNVIQPLYFHLSFTTRNVIIGLHRIEQFTVLFRYCESEAKEYLQSALNKAF